MIEIVMNKYSNPSSRSEMGKHLWHFNHTHVFLLPTYTAFTLAEVIKSH